MQINIFFGVIKWREKYKVKVDFLDRFLGCKRSTYTRVNTVGSSAFSSRILALWPCFPVLHLFKLDSYWIVHYPQCYCWCYSTILHFYCALYLLSKCHSKTTPVTLIRLASAPFMPLFWKSFEISPMFMAMPFNPLTGELSFLKASTPRRAVNQDWQVLPTPLSYSIPAEGCKGLLVLAIAPLQTPVGRVIHLPIVGSGSNLSYPRSQIIMGDFIGKIIQWS